MITKSHAVRAVSIYENLLVLQLALESFERDSTLEETPQVRGMRTLLKTIVTDADYLAGDSIEPDSNIDE
jgi:hypothetical protein